MMACYITCKNLNEAKKIGKHLVQKKLVGCVNIFPKVYSIYQWKGKIMHESESIIIGKTIENKKNKIIQEVKKIHSYDVPCIAFYKTNAVNNDYLNWLKGVM